MNFTHFRSLLVRTSFIAVNFIFFYSIAVASLRYAKTPIPENKDELVPVAHNDGVFTYEYRNGYTMAVDNTEALAAPAAQNEPMAFLSSCKSKAPIAKGELRILQSGYTAQDQDGDSLKLSCDLMPVSQVWLDSFLEALPKCIEESTQAVGWGFPDSLVVHSVMIYMHKGSSGKLSLHAPARAVDISKLELVYPEGSRDVVVSLAGESNNVGGDATLERKFLRAFRGCWSAYLVDHAKCSNWSKDNFRGSVGWEDSAHQNHLHLSRPFCPNDSNYKGG